MADVFLDPNIVIPLVEAEPSRRSALVARISALLGDGGRCVISDLVRLECRVKPLATENAPLLQDYEEYFASGDVTVASLAPSAYDRAAEVRARYGYPTADAIHLGAAIEAGCHVFATADKRLARCTDISVVLIDAD